MARGQPDYGLYAPTEQYATISDLTKAIAWLIDYFSSDGKGSVVFTDNFEGTLLKWNKLTSNGGTAFLDSTHAKSGSQSMKLDVAKVLVASAGIWREFGIQSSQRLGGEISFCKPSSNTFLCFALSYHNGTTQYKGSVKLDFSTYKLYYYSSADSWVEITTLDAFSASDQSFHPIKLVVDFDTLKYDRVIVDNTLYDLSSFSLYSAVSALNQRILWEVTLEGLNTTGGQLYVDDAIFTQEEP